MNRTIPDTVSLIININGLSTINSISYTGSSRNADVAAILIAVTAAAFVPFSSTLSAVL